MKTIYTAAVLFLLALVSSFGQMQGVLAEGTTNTQGPLYFTFTNLSMANVKLVYYPHNKGRLELRIRDDLAAMSGSSDSLNFLRDLVSEVVSLTNLIGLEDGGTITFQGGFPIWGPYIESTKTGVYRCLIFAEGAKLDGKSIKVTGSATRSPFYPEIMTAKPDPFKLSYKDPAGITLIRGGFYEFSLVEGNYSDICRNLGEMIEAFKANHPSLELEAMTTARMRQSPGIVVQVISYYVSFREKK